MDEGVVQHQPSEESLRDQLKIAHDQLRDLLPNYLRAFTAFVLITGGLFKFSLDANATPALRGSLAFLGFGLCAIGFAVCIFGHRLFQAATNDVAVITARLHLPKPTSTGEALRYTVWSATAFVVLVSFGWFAILFLV